MQPDLSMSAINECLASRRSFSFRGNALADYALVAPDATRTTSPIFASASASPISISRRR
jgi:hypothetical protein